jgi:hypothetical protein
MKYQQPFGISDPNASYINGNPSTGTMGSIPPAASIEFPQREIVNLISDVSIVPSDADLHQLARGIQTGKLSYAPDLSGVANQISITLTPAPTAYVAGLKVDFKLNNQITGPTQINVNGLGLVDLRGSNNSVLTANTYFIGDILRAEYDGSKFQLSNPRPPGTLIPLTAATTNYYVNPVTGSDTTGDGLTAGTAWATINKAWSWLQQNINANGKNININCAFPNNPTVYAQFTPVGAITGIFSANQLQIIGDTSTRRCSIAMTGSQVSAIQVSSGAMFSISGFTLSATGSFGGCLFCTSGSQVNWGAITFGAAGSYCVEAAGAGTTITGLSSLGTGIFNGNCISTFFATQSAVNMINSMTLTYNTIQCSGGTVGATNGGYIGAQAVTFAGVGVSVGARFALAMNGLLDTGGAQATTTTNYIPGASGGTVSTGGQFQ